MSLPGDLATTLKTERELVQMQAGLRAALQQKTRLAALGGAVNKINHDLRNILSTARLVSDRLVASEDPAVRRNSRALLAAIDRAVRYHAFSCQSLERILTVQARPRSALECFNDQYRPSLTDDTPVGPRPTADYQELLEEPDDHDPPPEAEG